MLHPVGMLNWLNNLFSSNGNNLNARRKTAMSTHDAFSLPTSSPVHSMHPRDSFARYASPSPDPESSSHAPSYAYPPPSSSSSPTNYDYFPSFKWVFHQPFSRLICFLCYFLLTMRHLFQILAFTTILPPSPAQHRSIVTTATLPSPRTNMGADT